MVAIPGFYDKAGQCACRFEAEDRARKSLYWIDDPKSEEDWDARETLIAAIGGSYCVRPDD